MKIVEGFNFIINDISFCDTLDACIATIQITKSSLCYAQRTITVRSTKLRKLRLNFT